VNLRDRLDAAVEAGILTREAADESVKSLKSLAYRNRASHSLVWYVMRHAADPDRARSFLDSPYTPLKERDALALIERLAKAEETPAPESARPRAERTVFLERLRLEVAREKLVGEDTATPVSGPELRRALVGFLAEHHASLLGVAPTEAEIDAAVRDFQLARGHLTPDAMEAFLEGEGLTVDRFFDLAREEAIVRKIEMLYRVELERRLRDGVSW
jgi:hypothetical protein